MNNYGLSDLLEHMKEKGYTPKERLIVYDLWRRYVGCTLFKPPLSEANNFYIELSNKVKTRLVKIITDNTMINFSKEDPLGFEEIFFNKKAATRVSTLDKITLTQKLHCL
jgi:hypothetical protein